VRQGDAHNSGLRGRSGREDRAGTDEHERERTDEFGRAAPQSIHQHGEEDK
jgi:hypothetical protein